MRVLLFLLVVLAFAACDSGDPKSSALDPGVFLGEWKVAFSDATNYATVSVEQDVPDFDHPATVGLDVRGDRLTTLTYVAHYTDFGDRTGYVRVMDVPYGTVADERTSLVIIRRGPGAYDSFEITTDSGDNLYLHELHDGAREALRFDRLGVTVTNVTVPLHGGETGEVVINGRLQFATRRVEAGEEVAEYEGLVPVGYPGSVIVDDADQLVFTEGGTLRLQTDTSNGIVTRTGTWSIDGEQLRLTLGSRSALFDVDAGARLRLVSSVELQVTDLTLHGC